MRKKISLIVLSEVMVLMLTACGTGSTELETGTEKAKSSYSAASEQEIKESSEKETNETSEQQSSIDSEESEEKESNSETASEIVTVANVTSTGMIDAMDMFTKRDLSQTADLSETENIEIKSGEDIEITKEGTYTLSGNAEGVTIYVEAGDEDKIQIVMDGVSIKNETAPCIYVKSADKVFVTTSAGSDNSLSVTGTFEADGDTNLDAVIFSKDDLTFNGLGNLVITSSDNGVACKDTLKVTGGSIEVSCKGNAFEAHDAIEMADGNIKVTECNDGFHAKDSDDDSVGYVYICGGSIDITAADDAIHSTTILQIDGGNIKLDAAEGMEATYVQVNGGDIDIAASDDGINAGQKSSKYTPTIEINDGNVKIVMGAGDTDGIDSNGNIYVNGGVLDISGQSTFDYDGNAEYKGGTIIENGVETNTITNQMMGGPGGFGGDFGGGFGGGSLGGFGDR